MSEEAKQRPLVAVGVIIIKPAKEKDKEKILVGERLASHGAGTYQLPGGHLEFGMSFEGQARAEVEEETGLTDIEFKGVVALANEIIHGKHYVNITFLVEWKSGEPNEGEAGKSRNWKWYSFSEIPEPMFASSRGCIDAWRSGKFLNEIRA